MFFVYLFSAISGGLLVLVSLVSGGHQDHGDGGDLGDGGDAAHQEALPPLASTALTSGDAHAGALTQSHGDHAGHGDHGGHGAGNAALGAIGTAAAWLLSLQLWTYLLAFGGLTGLLLRSVAHVGEPLAALLSLGVGLGTALGARAVLRRAMRSDDGVVTSERLIGATARVLIPAAAGGTGKIRLESRGHVLDLLAKSSDGSELAGDTDVLVLEVRGGVAEVTRDLELVPRRTPAALPPRAAARAKTPTPSKG